MVERQAIGDAATPIVPRDRKRGKPSRSITATMSRARARFAYGAWSGVEAGQPLRP